MRKIGIYGGSFDPIHLGHIALVMGIMEQRGLDHVLFIPAAQSPMKKECTASAADRCAMVEQALREVPQCSMLLLEVQRDPPSYTINTIKEIRRLKKVEEEDQLFILLGQDALQHFHQWQSVHELVHLAQPLVALRTGFSDSGMWQNDPLLAPIIREGICQTPLFDISSTAVRDRLKKKLFCGHMLNAHVLEYIVEEKLYGYDS